MTPEDPRHGTYAGAVAHYKAKQAPCQPCKEAKRSYSRRHSKESAMGRPRFVDAALLRRHVRALMANGMTQADIARAAGVSAETIRLLRNGGQKVNVKTYAAIAAVQAAESETFMPREVAARKIQALAAIGHELRFIANELGMKPQALANIIHEYRPNRGRVTRATWDAVDALYERLSMTPGPSARTRRISEARGWLPPLAWDDIDLDEAPTNATRKDASIDEMAIQRVLDGDANIAHNLNPEERSEVVRRWGLAGRSINDLARLTGWKPERYHRTQDAA